MTKTKKCPIETLATEVANRVWDFTTGKYSWRWKNGLGINLCLREGNDTTTGVLYAKNLDQAVMFAHGYESGRAAERRLFQSAGADHAD